MLKISKSLYEDIQLILEGGNVKIGDVGADSVKVTENSRPQVANDLHGMLSSLHDSFKKEHGHNLFGAEKKALHSRSAFSGSTTHLFDSGISHKDLVKHKSSFGDVDVKVPEEHLDTLHGHLTPGKKFGKYTVVGAKRGGSELHALMKHDNGEVHQVDFEKTKYEHNEPSKFDQFAHSADWNDIKGGIKGMHHKVLLNALGGTKNKFSIVHGLGQREGDPKWDKDTHSITKKLFGKSADEKHLHSFKGLVHLMKTHLPKNKQQEVTDKFKESVSKMKGADHSNAISHMQRELGTV